LAILTTILYHEAWLKMMDNPMNTIVTDWCIVSVMEGMDRIGEVIWGTVVDDMTCRFATGDYLCTSQIMKVNSSNQLITTSSGSLYQVIGTGKKAIIDFDDFELLRNGFSPQQINQLNLASNDYFH
jgi:hypothetical protein